jgi:hypothetical protein
MCLFFVHLCLQIRALRSVIIRDQESAAAQLASSAAVAATNHAALIKSHEDTTARLETKLAQRTAEMDATIASYAAQLGAARQEVVNMSDRMSAAAAASSSAQVCMCVVFPACTGFVLFILSRYPSRSQLERLLQLEAQIAAQTNAHVSTVKKMRRNDDEIVNRSFFTFSVARPVRLTRYMQPPDASWHLPSPPKMTRSARRGLHWLPR